MAMKGSPSCGLIQEQFLQKLLKLGPVSETLYFPEIFSRNDLVTTGF